MQKKPENVKIVQISAVAVESDYYVDGKHVVYGLGDDQNIYQWSASNGYWLK